MDVGVVDEGLVGLILGSMVADLGFVGEEDEPAEGVEGFAFVELTLDTASVGLVLEVGEQEPGLAARRVLGWRGSGGCGGHRFGDGSPRGWR